MVETRLLYNPDFVIHPGETLKDEIKFLNLTQVELAQRTGLSEKHISQIINGADPITSDTAIKLELALGIPANFWNNLQKNYELNLARIESGKRINKEIEACKKFSCYSELMKLGYVGQASDWRTKTENLLKFFGLNSFASIQDTVPIAFRQALGKFNKYSLAAWLRCGEIEAKKIETGEFNKTKIKEAIPEFKKLTLLPDGFSQKLRGLCSSMGIAVVYTPYLKNTKVNGSARWVGNKAVIQLNTRGAFSDIFWFTFFHEVGHVLLHGVKGEFLDYQGKARDEKEKEADIFAAEALIPETDYHVFLEDKPLNRQKLENFAKSMSVSIGIVLGRLAHEGKASWKRIAHLRDRFVIRP